MSDSLRGADVLAASLARAGTRYLFSLSGNQIMPVYDAALDAGLEIVHVRHEGAAVHMADAWGRLTEVPGVALVTGGPGHANAIGALYTAAAADSPLVLLSGHAPLAQLGMDAFQEMRQADMAAPVVKASWTAQSAGTLGEDIARAFRIARSGRPGPVHLSLPFDVLEAKASRSETALPSAGAFLPALQPLSAGVGGEIAAQMLRARRPLIIAGPMLTGMRGRTQREALARACGIPVLGMESPRGVNDPALGAVAEALQQADLVLLLGKKLDFTLRFGRAPAFAPDCRFIQIDPDEAVLARAKHALGDPGRIAGSVRADPIPALDCLAAMPIDGRGDAGWASEVEAAVTFRPPAWALAGNRAEGPLHPAEVGRAVATALAKSPSHVVVIDGGEFGQWAQACVDAPLRLINGPAGSIGSALPFALAAKLAHPEATVAVLLGDGTFGFHMAEFDTAVRNKLALVAIVGNDACWNAEHQIQLNSYGAARAVGCELLPTRYDEVVEALGGHGELVQISAELPAALGRAFASGKPACVNVMLERLAAPNVSRHASGAPSTGH
ncbi:MAG: thiamine pyrophosphate-binding protein [Betaproteobacteria bacterium]|nr:thiamine pyrophosphate-binding protein [Betaproteobacteria bacterium]